MHNKVVFHAMKALNGLGFPALRFNFRGVGRSEGKHDDGRGERYDVRAALDWLDREYHLPIVFAGFSFGASVGLRAACPDARVQALISLGTPVEVEGRAYQYNFLQACPKPKLFLKASSPVTSRSPRAIARNQSAMARSQRKKTIGHRAADSNAVMHAPLNERLPRFAKSFKGYMNIGCENMGI